jgi:hypothetical protein
MIPVATHGQYNGMSEDAASFLITMAWFKMLRSARGYDISEYACHRLYNAIAHLSDRLDTHLTVVEPKAVKR